VRSVQAVVTYWSKQKERLKAGLPRPKDPPTASATPARDATTTPDGAGSAADEGSAGKGATAAAKRDDEDEDEEEEDDEDDGGHHEVRASFNDAALLLRIQPSRLANAVLHRKRRASTVHRGSGCARLRCTRLRECSR
jgi:hypothetical protein